MLYLCAREYVRERDCMEQVLESANNSIATIIIYRVVLFTISVQPLALHL